MMDKKHHHFHHHHYIRTIIPFILIAGGVLLLIAYIPMWLWVVALGILSICCGIFILRKWR